MATKESEIMGDLTMTTTERSSRVEDATPEELIGRSINGDRDAAAELVHRYERLVWSVVRGTGLRGATAEDVSQTVWATFFTKLHTIRSADAIAGWLATVARNASMASLRKSSRERPVESEYLDGSFEIDMSEGVVREEESARLVRAFNRLPDECRELLRLVAADLSYKEISELTGRPIGAIGPTRMRALDKLRTLYLDDEGATAA